MTVDRAGYLAYLGTEVEVVIDRPMGSSHPDWEFVYQVNYGYLPGTRAGDGEEVDAYVLGVKEPVESFTGRCIAVAIRQDDVEYKLIVSPWPMSAEKIMREIGFVEDHYETEIIVAPNS